MRRYDEFDDKLLCLIKNQRATFRTLCEHLKAEAAAIAPRGGDGWRVVDRRLAALRKAGKISPERHGREILWVINSPKIGDA